MGLLSMLRVCMPLDRRVFEELISNDKLDLYVSKCTYFLKELKDSKSNAVKKALWYCGYNHLD